ncbi:hypothetical protein Y032_0033g2673 [Ancylostoma ceylanicum]|uniref:Uncharacterized protein n=1 Tax=Ancylostoma ceylanicum TaxID=53326 RepID=A0A016UNL9_9BILA|nr:hypothetical protein Y032_0033g2673 [Ancylostoma ceylanicum]
MNNCQDNPNSPLRRRFHRERRASCHCGTINNVKLIDKGTIATVSARGKTKPLCYFNGQLRERMNPDKEEREPARIHFNISTPSFSSPSSTKKPRQTNRRGVRIFADDYSDCENNIMEETIEGGSIHDSDENSRKVTLGDFLGNRRAARSKKQRTSNPELDYEFLEKEILTTPTKLVEIGDVINAQHIFEIFELDI